jgi:hypothetical protein
MTFFHPIRDLAPCIDQCSASTAYLTRANRRSPTDLYLFAANIFLNCQFSRWTGGSGGVMLAGTSKFAAFNIIATIA